MDYVLGRGGTQMASKNEKLCAEISNGLVSEPWYEETTNSIIEVRKEICGCGGDRVKTLLNKYDELCLKIHCAIEERIYETVHKNA